MPCGPTRFWAPGHGAGSQGALPPELMMTLLMITVGLHDPRKWNCAVAYRPEDGSNRMKVVLLSRLIISGLSSILAGSGACVLCHSFH